MLISSEKYKKNEKKSIWTVLFWRHGWPLDMPVPAVGYS